MSDTLPLGQLAAKTGENTRQIQRVVDEGFAPKPKKKGQYDVWAVVRGIIRYYKDKSAKVSESRTLDAARKATAEADTAEMAAAEKRGTLMLKSKHLAWVSELGTQTRVRIMQSQIPDDAKKKLCKEISEIQIGG